MCKERKNICATPKLRRPGRTSGRTQARSRREKPAGNKTDPTGTARKSDKGGAGRQKRQNTNMGNAKRNVMIGQDGHWQSVSGAGQDVKRACACLEQKYGEAGQRDTGRGLGDNRAGTIRSRR